MVPSSPERLLLVAAALHGAVGLVAAGALAVEVPSTLGEHPALKPMKFGFSIALYLGTMAFLVPLLTMTPAMRKAVAWIVVVGMAIEMAAIAVQALRGVPSHFNQATPLDTVIWKLMAATIVGITLVMIGVVAVALLRPIMAPPVQAAAWRAGLVFFALAAFTGFRMADRLSHTVAPYGDLRLAHAVGVHALQSLPLVGAALVRVPLTEPVRWLLLALAVMGHLALAGWALARRAF